MKRRKAVTNISAIQALETISTEALPIANYHESVTEFLRH
jgi:hypothetical protein